MKVDSNVGFPSYPKVAHWGKNQIAILQTYLDEDTPELTVLHRKSNEYPQVLRVVLDLDSPGLQEFQLQKQFLGICKSMIFQRKVQFKPVVGETSLTTSR